MFFKRFALLTTIVVLIMSVDYLGVVRKFTPGANAQGGLGEFLALPVFTCAGLMWMASAVDFVMIFVSLELVTISFYVLVSYTRRNAASLEAGVKYLVLGALSTGFFVYGITWIFGITGQTNLDRVAAFLKDYHGSTAPVLFSFVLLTIALGFKIAAVPFQIWVPDVYQGAPTPVAAFLSVGSKAAGFVVFMRVLSAFSGRACAPRPDGTDPPDRGRRDSALRQPCGPPAEQPQTAARLLEHRSRGLPVDRRGERGPIPRPPTRFPSIWQPTCR